ncbi:hypothetical protein GJV07_16780 [Enterobacteriaceae bacterium RIT711]|nr:hypothetical protein [Enterobacteriaceae bacterium RIT711]
MLTPQVIREATSFAFNNAILKNEKIIAYNLIGTSIINKCNLNNCLIDTYRDHGSHSRIEVLNGKVVNSLFKIDGDLLLFENFIESSVLNSKGKLHIKNGVLQDSFIRLNSGISLQLDGVESRSIDIDNTGERLSEFSIKGLLVDCVLRGLVTFSGIVNAIIYSSVLRSCFFENTSFESTVINKCNLQRVVFMNCNLKNITFSHCNIVERPLVLEGCDVTGAHFLNIPKGAINFINCYGAEKVHFIK